MVGLVAAAFLCGFISREQKLPPYATVMRLYESATYHPVVRAVFKPLQRVLRGRTPRRPAPLVVELEGATAPLTASQRAQLEQLQAIGYLGGVRPAPAVSGVLRHDPARAHAGLNLLASGHGTEAVLMDMDGRSLHRWAFDFWQAFPEHSRLDAQGTGHWRRVRLLPDGDLLAIYDNKGLIRLDRDSRLRWAYAGRTHHDLDVAADGSIYVLEGRLRLVPEIFAERPVIEDFVTVLSPEGRLLRRVSLLGALASSDYAPLLARVPERGDIFHTNTLQLLDGSQAHRLAAFASGNVLVSMRELDVIAVVDLDRESVRWAMTGMWRKQHEPELLANGNVLLFDNQGRPGGSRVLEFDPRSQELIWVYAGRPAEPFFSAKLGSNQRLPNGNTLITESEAGRAIEVTPDGTIVWELVSPFRAGERGDRIANLFDVVRLAGEQASWLEVAPEEPGPPANTPAP